MAHGAAGAAGKPWGSGYLISQKRRRRDRDQATRQLLSATRALRKRYAQSKNPSAQKSVPLFDQIIANMESDAVLETAALSILDQWVPKSDRANFFSRNMQYA